MRQRNFDNVRNKRFREVMDIYQGVKTNSRRHNFRSVARVHQPGARFVSFPRGAEITISKVPRRVGDCRGDDQWIANIAVNCRAAICTPANIHNRPRAGDTALRKLHKGRHACDIARASRNAPVVNIWRRTVPRREDRECTWKSLIQ